MSCWHFRRISVNHLTRILVIAQGDKPCMTQVVRRCPIRKCDLGRQRRLEPPVLHIDSAVSAYDPKERFAAGEYSNQHPLGDGLPNWTKANRKVDDTEITLW